MRNWENLTSDEQILQNAEGARLEFDSKPFQGSVPRPYVCNAEQTAVIDKEVSELIKKDVVVQVALSNDLFVSNVFLRPKPDGKWRLIIDLSDLNVFVTKHHFKMDHLEDAVNLLFPEAWLASIDLREAYYAIPIHPDDWKYLCFQWRHKFYVFTCLPFGLSSAPWLFTKTLKPIFAEFHKKGFSGFGYIDDTFVIAESKELCERAVEFLIQIFTNLGFRVHDQKSVLKPSHELTFLGYVLNSEEMSVRPTKDKISRVKSLIEKILGRTIFKIREIASVIGILNDLCKGSNYGIAHVKSLEIQKIIALRSAGNLGFEGKMKLNEYCREELRWWLCNIENIHRDIQISPPSLILETDASNEGWGAKFGSTSTGGRWSEKEKELHINALELKAVSLGFQSLCRKVSHEGIKILSDNTTTVAYLNHGGGTKSTICNKISKEVWSCCEKQNVWLLSTHIPGVQNCVADYESRHFSEDTEWKLNPELFAEITSEWGIPDIDLFASRHNFQVENYASWGPDPFALFVNAFSENWHKYNYIYVFPPFRLLNRVLQKVKSERVRTLVIAPDWPGQPWYAPLLQAASQLMRFPRKSGNLLRDDVFQKMDRSLENIPILAILIS